MRKSGLFQTGFFLSPVRTILGLLRLKLSLQENLKAATGEYSKNTMTAMTSLEFGILSAKIRLGGYGAGLADFRGDRAFGRKDAAADKNVFGISGDSVIESSRTFRSGGEREKLL